MTKKNKSRAEQAFDIQERIGRQIDSSMSWGLNICTITIYLL